MKYYVIKDNKSNSHQLVEVNSEIAADGYFISPEDFQHLLEVQQQAYKRNNLVDMNSNIIFTIANIVKQSRYIHVDQYITLIEDFINLFYDCKSRTTKVIYDDEFVSMIYDCYISRHGVIDLELIQMILKELEKQ